MTYLPPIFPLKPQANRRRRWFVAPLIVAVAWGGMFLIGHLWKGPISVVNNITVGGIRALISGSDGPRTVLLRDDPEYQMPDKEDGRLDVLLLGIRGEDDPLNGGLLTDTILLLSLDEGTGEASLVSIPRDLTVRITDTITDKINSAYLRLGMDATKRLFSRMTGVYVDHAIVLDFTSFQAIVDAVGGVTITLDAPFQETEQWGYSFSLPEGENHLSGEQALYYARSRYSTSDFDRARRQQQLILAIKERIGELGLLGDPLTAIKVLTAVRKHVETDLDIFDLKTLTRLARLAGDTGRVRRYVLTSEDLLYERTDGGVYRLIPRGGTLAHLKAFMGSLPKATKLPIIELTPSSPAP